MNDKLFSFRRFFMSSAQISSSCFSSDTELNLGLFAWHAHPTFYVEPIAAGCRSHCSWWDVGVASSHDFFHTPFFNRFALRP